MDIEKIIRSLDHTSDCVITVLGDFCLDKYLYVDPRRDELSVETGLVAYQVDHKAIFAGVGGTITNNLRALGVQVYCVGIIGDDGEGFELLQALKGIGANTEYMIKTDLVCTTTYTKPMRLDEDSYKEMNRLDFRNFTPTPVELEQKMIENLLKVLDKSDAVLISDQYLLRNCSAVTDYIRNAVSELASKHKDKIFYADSRGFINEYRNIMVKCNNFEAVHCIKPDFTGEVTEEIVVECGKALYERNKNTVFITLGERGAIVFDQEVVHVPTFKVEGPVDITGAGDAANAGFVLGLSLGLDKEEACLMGNCVASITVQQIGVTGTASAEQVKERLKYFK